MSAIKVAAVILASGFIFGCEADIAILPAPEKMTEYAVGNYCNMILIEHEGPKAQLFEKGKKSPLWFTAVRDAIAYTRLPGEGQSVVAIYVHDMGKARSWASPQTDGIWILATTAFYVVGSEKRGGMGMTEVVPFGAQEKAAQFAREFGGEVVTYSEIPNKNLFPDFDEPAVNAGLSKTERAVQ